MNLEYEEGLACMCKCKFTEYRRITLNFFSFTDNRFSWALISTSLQVYLLWETAGKEVNFCIYHVTITLFSTNTHRIRQPAKIHKYRIARVDLKSLS